MRTWAVTSAAHTLDSRLQYPLTRACTGMYSLHHVNLIVQAITSVLLPVTDILQVHHKKMHFRTTLGKSIFPGSHPTPEHNLIRFLSFRCSVRYTDCMSRCDELSDNCWPREIERALKRQCKKSAHNPILSCRRSTISTSSILAGSGQGPTVVNKVV